MKRSMVVGLAAFGTLAAAQWYGASVQGRDEGQLLVRAFPGLALTPTEYPTLYAATATSTGAPAGTVAVGEGRGWGGPLRVATWVDTQGEIAGVRLLRHVETESFLRLVLRERMLERIAGRNVADPLTSEAVDLISGATMTSRAVLGAAREGAHGTGQALFGLSYASVPSEIRFGVPETGLLILYSFVVVASILRRTNLRKLGLAGGFVVIGLLASTPLSLASFAGLVMGYVPRVEDNLFWWLLALGAVLGPLLLKKNLYCSWMCPFAAIEEALAAIGGVRIRVSRTMSRVASWAVLGLIWLSLLCALVTQNPALATYEPFFLFSLQGSSMQWYLASAALLGAFLIPRFWCRFFCPVGEILTGLLKVRTQLGRAGRRARLPVLRDKVLP